MVEPPDRAGIQRLRSLDQTANYPIVEQAQLGKTTSKCSPMDYSRLTIRDQIRPTHDDGRL